MNRTHILKTALDLFNRRGYSKTHLEDLLEEADITKPNFLDHFDNLEEVVTILFIQLCEESDEAAEKIDKSVPVLGMLHEIMLASYQIQVKYRFIFHDFYNILTKIEIIKDRYFELISLRKTQLKHLFENLVGEGIFKKEMIPGQFDNLASQITMLSDYWLAHNQIMFGPPPKPAFYSKLNYSIIVPYLSEIGLGEFKKFLKTTSPKLD
ncbi:TetR/AcrR family transcriptional regulator [Echinicola jeungdonensis]|uniref:TetR/AcrR family transcriptional regulator n=1 Tax=Echinicola jeungdonensis TaxID=709343 RepID=A0ABV5J4J6_9BACT|nr:TetR/AcrR family transcriptional regulator [Echinicola jeungdonensis]MDN3668754.1 TetR/AcrR family transcriptional regulator [Echinicola jeungdonensis]